MQAQAPTQAQAQQEPDGDADPAGVATATYGVIQIGSAQVALPLDALREVVPCPARFEGLLAAAPGLLGALNLRGRVVPVIDLRLLMGMDAGADGGNVVVMMRHAGRLIGLLADGVRGITRPPPAAVYGVDTYEPGGLLFSRSFERPEDASIVSILDAAAVLALPGLPMLRDDGLPSGLRIGERRGMPRRPMMLVRCADIGLAMDVADVHTTLPEVTLKASCLSVSICRGVIEYGDVDVPAIDPLALLGLGSLPPGEPCQALLLRLDAGLVAVLVSQVIDIAQVSDDELLPLPGAALRRPACFNALLRPQGRGDYLALKQGALPAEADVKALATMNVQRALGAAAGQGGAQGQGRAVISFDIGAEAATALLQVREIIALPAERIRTRGAQPAVMGLFTHRRHAVTLVCLASLMGRTVEHDAGARVLLIDTAPSGDVPGATVGFVVPRLCGVETALWEQAAATVNPAAPKKPFAGCPLVEVGTGGQRRTLPLIDLQALACELIGVPVAAAPTAAKAVATAASPITSATTSATASPTASPATSAATPQRAESSRAARPTGATVAA